MQEWFNWHAWKACVPQKGTGGSNPFLSAKTKQTIRQSADGFIFRRTKQNLFCEGHEKNKTYREAGLLCKELPQGIIKGNPSLPVLKDL